MQSAHNPSTSISSRWLIVVLLMLYAGLAHFNRVGISVAGSEVFIRDYGISETKMGWVYTAFLIVYTLGMLPGGWLIDRIGAAKALTLLGLWMGSFVALTGTLGWLTTEPLPLWMGLIVIRSLAGLGNSPLHPGAAHVVSDVTPPRGRATANGLVTAGALLGIASCYPVFGWLIDHITWPWAFVVSGLALVGYGVLWRVLATPRLPGPQPEEPSDSKPGEVGAGRTLFLSGNLWLLTLSYAAFGYFQYLFFYWMNYYFQDVLKVPELEARQCSFFITIAQGAGMAIGGMSTDVVCRMFGTTFGRRSIVMSGMGLSAVFGLLAVRLTDHMDVALSLAVAMGALGMCEGVFWTTATDIGGKARGFSGAFMNTGGNLGGLISPVLTPAMAKHIGWPGSIAIACAISGIGGLVWFWIRPPAEEKKGPDEQS